MAVILGSEEAREEREHTLSARLTDLDLWLSEAEAHVLKLGDEAGDLASIEAALSRAHSIEATVDKEINALRETMAGLNAGIRAQSEEAVEVKWRETSEALTAANARMPEWSVDLPPVGSSTVGSCELRSQQHERQHSSPQT